MVHRLRGCTLALQPCIADVASGCYDRSLRSPGRAGTGCWWSLWDRNVPSLAARWVVAETVQKVIALVGNWARQVPLNAVGSTILGRCPGLCIAHGDFRGCKCQRKHPGRLAMYVHTQGSRVPNNAGLPTTSTT